MVTSGGPPLDPPNLMNFNILEPLWVHDALGNMLTSMESNSHLGNGLEPQISQFLAPIFFSMSPTMDFLIDEISISRAPGDPWI